MPKCKSCGASFDTDDVICDTCANKLLKAMGEWTLTERSLYWMYKNILWIVLFLILAFVFTILYLSI